MKYQNQYNKINLFIFYQILVKKIKIDIIRNVSEMHALEKIELLLF